MASTVAKISSHLSKLSQIPLLEKISPPSTHAVTDKECERFLIAQRLAYDSAIHAALKAEVGMTEQDLAQLMHEYVHDRGIRSYFHRPLAWFGDRSRFGKMRSGKDALPQNRPLQEGEVITLDTAPLVNGHVGDIGFTFALQPHPELKKARAFLLEIREEVRRMFADPNITAKQIWWDLDEKIKERGYENCYKKYQFSILGHRVHKIPLSFLPSPMGIFSSHSYWALLTRGFFPELLTPHHEGSKEGLWAIEPHFGVNREFGIKFEEILVVKGNEAYWLDDHVPHLKLPKGLS